MANKIYPKEVLLEAAWIRGRLKYKLRKHQLPIYDVIWKVIKNEISSRSYVVLAARRFGKTFTNLLIAIEYALQNPNIEIQYIAPTQSQLMKAIRKSFNTIIADAPEKLKPELTSSNEIKFANGSVIYFSGTDMNPDGVRGSGSNLNIVEEAAFINNLDYIFRSQLIKLTRESRGKTVFVTTPPITNDHDFIAIYNQHKDEDLVIKFTIYDSDLSPEEIEEEIRLAGGKNSTSFKREDLCEFVTETDMAIVSEWNKEFVTENNLVRVEPKDQFYNYYHKYISLDTGVKDLTVGLFAYYDYQQAKVFVEDELVMNGTAMTTLLLSTEIKNKRDVLWPQLKVYKHIADSNNLHLIQDLSITYNLPFYGVTKGRLLSNDRVEPGMVNKLKVMVGQGRIIINPKCEHTIGCLENGVWATNQRGSLFAKSKKYGHYDALAALIYLVISIDYNTNPVPTLLGYNHENFHISKEVIATSQQQKNTWSKLIKQ